jgi:hypothetical protein
VYAFIYKKKDKLKLLHWRVGGFVLYYKRLEKRIFELPEYKIDEGLVVLTYTEMIMILDVDYRTLTITKSLYKLYNFLNFKYLKEF